VVQLYFSFLFASSLNSFYSPFASKWRRSWSLTGLLAHIRWAWFLQWVLYTLQEVDRAYLHTKRTKISCSQIQATVFLHATAFSRDTLVSIFG
jgi:hypothetical protein